MKDEKDLEELGELVRVLEEIRLSDIKGKCGMCPLYYPLTYAKDECDQIMMDMHNKSMYAAGANIQYHCKKVLCRKIDEVTRYMLERSLS